MKLRALIAATAFLLAPVAANADSNGIAIKEMLSTTQTVAGQPIEVPENPKLNVSTYTIAPGAKLPIHKHPYPRYAYVLSGTIDVILVDTHQTLHFKQGDFFAEIIDGWHFGVNNGSVPVKLLVIDQVPQNVESNTVKQDISK